MIRIVLDTNVLVSALLFGGLPARIVKLVNMGAVELFISPFILEEFESKLITKFKFSSFAAREARADIEAISHQVHPKQTVHVIKRKDADNRILECARAAEVQALVTGNMKDIRILGTFQGIEILTPREFIDKYYPTPA